MAPSPDDYVTYKTVLSPELFAIAWQPFYDRAVRRTNDLKAKFLCKAGISYGDSLSQTLDIYFPASMTAKSPTLVFLHGGAFREGHPGQYGFVGEPYLERGAAFISAGYRVAPEAYYPDQVDDLALLLGWLNRNLTSFGLNASRMVVSGHSSGALMIALASVRSDWQEHVGVPRNFLKSIIVAGANYDHRTDSPTNLVRDLSRREEGTVICNLQQVPEKALIVFGNNEINTGDGRRFGRSGRALAAALAERGTVVEVIPLDTDHQGTCNALCDPDSPVFRAAMLMLDERARN